jgi:hypothetical protein
MMSLREATFILVKSYTTEDEHCGFLVDVSANRSPFYSSADMISAWAVLRHSLKCRDVWSLKIGQFRLRLEKLTDEPMSAGDRKP